MLEVRQMDKCVEHLNLCVQLFFQNPASAFLLLAVRSILPFIAYNEINPE